MECLDDQMMYRFFEKLLSEEEKREVTEHLNGCEICYGLVVSFMRISLNRPNMGGDVVLELLQQKSISQKEQVDLILKYIKEDEKHQPLKGRLGRRIKRLLKNIRSKFC